MSLLGHGLSRVFPTEPKISLPHFPYHNRISQPICFSLFRHQACSNADQETSIGQLRQPQSFRVQWLARAGQGESLPGFLKALPWAAIPARVKFRAAKAPRRFSLEDGISNNQKVSSHRSRYCSWNITLMDLGINRIVIIGMTANLYSRINVGTS